METTESDRTAQNLSSLKGLENSNVHFPALTCWATIVPPCRATAKAGPHGESLDCSGLQPKRSRTPCRARSYTPAKNSFIRSSPRFRFCAEVAYEMRT